SMRTRGTRPVGGPYSWEDFCALVRDRQKADLIDGVIYLASPDTPNENQIFISLLGLVSTFVETCDLGKLYGCRVAARLARNTAPEPDILFVSKRHLHRVKLSHIEGPPDIAVEIVSPDSIDRDYNLKRQKYEAAGVSEYWIIDEIEETVT